MAGPQKGQGGRPPTPVEAKKRRGTDRPDRRAGGKAELVAVPAIDASVAVVTVEQALERSLIAGARWLAESDSLTVVLLRESLEHLVTVRADPKSKSSEVTDAIKTAMTLAGLCGFSPSARTQMGLAEVKAMSKMEELRAKQAGGSKVADTGS